MLPLYMSDHIHTLIFKNQKWKVDSGNVAADKESNHIDTLMKLTKSQNIVLLYHLKAILPENIRSDMGLLQKYAKIFETLNSLPPKSQLRLNPKSIFRYLLLKSI